MNPLHIKIGEVDFHTPVFVASGTFGYGQEAAEVVKLEGLGAIVTKSIGAAPRFRNAGAACFDSG